MPQNLYKGHNLLPTALPQPKLMSTEVFPLSPSAQSLPDASTDASFHFSHLYTIIYPPSPELSRIQILVSSTHLYPQTSNPFQINSKCWDQWFLPFSPYSNSIQCGDLCLAMIDILDSHMTRGPEHYITRYQNY